MKALLYKIKDIMDRPCMGQIECDSKAHAQHTVNCPSRSVYIRADLATDSHIRLYASEPYLKIIGGYCNECGNKLEYDNKQKAANEKQVFVMIHVGKFENVM